MQNIARKQNTTIAMAFLFVSLVITPLSFKALGISPNFSAGVEAWQRVAAIFGDSHQPISASELLALNTALDETHPAAILSSTNSLLASIQPLNEQQSVEPAGSVDEGVVGSPAPATKTSSPCAKTMKPARRTTPSAVMPANVAVCVEKARAESARVAEVIRMEVPTANEARLNYERAVAKYRVSLREAMKYMPKDFKFTVRVKPPALPAMTSCDFHKAATPETVKPLPAVKLLIPSATFSEAPEASEL